MIVAIIVAIVTGVMALIIHRKIRYPNNGWFLCFLNVTLTPYRLIFSPFVPIAERIEKVMVKSKAADFGENENLFRYMYDWLENTETFKSIRYSNVGKMMADMEMDLTMARRLNKNKYLAANPEIRDIPVRSPVFVVGLGRSGTTFLHRLLSLDPAVRSPYFWECLNGVPIKATVNMSDPEAMAKDRKKRKDLMKKNLAQRDWMGDSSLEHIHEVGYDLPEECLYFLSNDLPFTFNYFFSVMVEAKNFFYSPKHKEHLESAFRAHKEYLQLLTFQGEDVAGEPKVSNQNDKKDKRWVLKCPLHLWMVKPLASVYPDAKFIWAHRHPVKNFSSVCGLCKGIFSMYYERDDGLQRRAARAFYSIIGKALNQAPVDMKESNIPCADVMFEQLVKDPVGVVESIYKQYNWDLSDEYRAILKTYIAENAAKRKKTSAGDRGLGSWHSLEGLGVTKEELMSGEYASYVKTFNISEEKSFKS